LMHTLVNLSRVTIEVRQDPERLRPSDTPVVLGDFTRLERDTGWRPEIPIERTLSDLLDHWRSTIGMDGAAR
jgi:GDP-4-dehydro-6-deoxy-D-mannose reductase